MCLPELVSSMIPIFARLPLSMSWVDKNPSPIWSRSVFCARTSDPMSTVRPYRLRVVEGGVDFVEYRGR